MPFNSAVFLFLFLPIILGVYHLAPGRFKNSVLLLFSLFFYTWGDQAFVLVLLYTVLVNYQCGRLIQTGYRRLGLTISLIINISLLAFFKYYNFTFTGFHHLLDLLSIQLPYLNAIPGLLAPVGISFYTFRSVSYSLDVYHGKVKHNASFVEFATYLTMFPLLLAGPIVRYADIGEQFVNRRISLTNFSAGVERFIIGLAKKMLIANTFASIANGVFNLGLTELSSQMAWVGVIAFTIQIYFDFSGYSDMAIGLGKMLGFDFPENFNYPYISRNIREFWTRWHITLSSWLRDYLFLPMAFSLSRKLKGERYFTVRTDHLIYLCAMGITFVTCGLWHGAAWNYIIWGVWFGLFITIEHVGFGRLLKRTWRPIQHLYTLLVVMFGWVIFRSESLPQAFGMIRLLFSFTPGDVGKNSYLAFFSLNAETYFYGFMALVFIMPAYPLSLKIARKFSGERPALYTILKTMKLLALITILVISIAYVAAGTFNPFVYARF